jgi:hypothetical protein
LRQKFSNDASYGAAVVYDQNTIEVMDSHSPPPKVGLFKVLGMFTPLLRMTGAR